MKTIIFSDGASSGNPGSAGFSAIVIKGQEIKEHGGHEKISTNNRMEIMGAIKGLEDTEIGDDVTVYTDSSYLLNGITKWIFGWQKNNWHTQKGEDVLNKDLWKRLFDLTQDRQVKWNLVKGHTNVGGNNRADEIAVLFSQNKKPKLFHGHIKDYDHSVLVPSGDDVEENTIGARKNARAYSYLSLIDGVLEKHSMWIDCERRVKGASNAKFRKAISPEDEKAIMKEWGI